MTPAIRYLQFETSGVAYSIHINGIKIVADRLEPQSQNTFPINQWLQPGRNELSVNLTIPYEQEEYREGKSALVTILGPGEEDGQQIFFARLNWTDTLGEAFPINLSTVFHVEPDFPRPFWMDADVLPMQDVANEGIRAAIESLHARMADGDLRGFQAGVRVKTEEMAAAYGIDSEARMESQREFMGELFRDPAWGMQPFDTKLAFELEAGSKLMKVTDKKGKSALKSSELSDGTEFSLELYFARKDGVWVLCR